MIQLPATLALTKVSTNGQLNVWNWTPPPPRALESSPKQIFNGKKERIHMTVFMIRKKEMAAFCLAFGGVLNDRTLYAGQYTRTKKGTVAKKYSQGSASSSKKKKKQFPSYLLFQMPKRQWGFKAT